MSTDPFENFRKRKEENDKMERKNLPNENVGKISNYFEVPEELKNAPSGSSDVGVGTRDGSGDANLESMIHKVHHAPGGIDLDLRGRVGARRSGIGPSVDLQGHWAGEAAFGKNNCSPPKV